jgi:hypothetical protein
LKKLYSKNKEHKGQSVTAKLHTFRKSPPILNREHGILPINHTFKLNRKLSRYLLSAVGISDIQGDSGGVTAPYGDHF